MLYAVLQKTFLLLIGCWAIAMAVVDPEFLLQNYRAGRVSASMTPAQAAKQYPANRVKQWAPFPNVNVIDILESGKAGAATLLRLNLDSKKERIWLISVLDKRFRTSRGIGVDSTFGELRKAHPSLTVRMEEGEMDGYIVAEINGEGIACQLTYDDATWKKMQASSDSRNIPVSVIPDNKQIQSISVYQPAP